MSLAADANHIAQRQSSEVDVPDVYERDAMENWQLVANVSITGIFALAILAALYFMRDMVVPVILAWVVANTVWRTLTATGWPAALRWVSTAWS